MCAAPKAGGCARRKAVMNSRETLVRIILVALLLYSLAGFVAVRREQERSELMAEQMQQQAEALRLANGELESKIQQGQSPEEMQQLARERLGLVLPGEKLFYFSTDREG